MFEFVCCIFFVSGEGLKHNSTISTYNKSVSQHGKRPDNIWNSLWVFNNNAYIYGDVCQDVFKIIYYGFVLWVKELRATASNVSLMTLMLCY